MGIPRPHLSLVATRTLPALTLGDLTESDPPQCGCGGDLDLHQPDVDRPDRLLGVCARGCPWTLVEILGTEPTLED
jgi:hypothetical protein